MMLLKIKNALKCKESLFNQLTQNEMPDMHAKEHSIKLNELKEKQENCSLTTDICRFPFQTVRNWDH